MLLITRKRDNSAEYLRFCTLLWDTKIQNIDADKNRKHRMLRKNYDTTTGRFTLKTPSAKSEICESRKCPNNVCVCSLGIVQNIYELESPIAKYDWNLYKQHRKHSVVVVTAKLVFCVYAKITKCHDKNLINIFSMQDIFWCGRKREICKQVEN